MRFEIPHVFREAQELTRLNLIDYWSRGISAELLAEYKDNTPILDDLAFVFLGAVRPFPSVFIPRFTRSGAHVDAVDEQRNH